MALTPLPQDSLDLLLGPQAAPKKRCGERGKKGEGEAAKCQARPPPLFWEALGGFGEPWGCL